MGVGDSKYVVIFDPFQPGHVTRRMRNVLYGLYTGKMQAWLDTAMTGPLQPNISVTLPVRKEVSTDHLYETTYRGENGHVTDDVT